MAKKSLGHVQLEWTCPNCDTRNRGNQKDCVNCGAPQPEDVKFEQTAKEELISDKETLAQAKIGPDIHCFYCGTRNPGDATTCSECGGDLVQGEARKAGQVIGAHRTGTVEDITCPSCDTMNPGDATECSNCGTGLRKPEAKEQVKAMQRPSNRSTKRASTGSSNKFMLAGVALVAIVFLACCSFFMFNTTDVGGRVESVAWTRTINVEELVPVEQEGWKNEIPTEADMFSCTQKVHHTQDNPTSNSKEICGTPYTVDQGNGFGEVVQDCKYQVYDDWCTYTVDRWQTMPNQAVTLSGRDYNPRWPNRPRLGRNQREGNRTENYQIIFDTDGKTYSYDTSNINIFNQCQIDSRWILEINQFDMVMDIRAN